MTEKKKKEKAPASTEASASTSGGVAAVKEAGKKVKEAVESKKGKPAKAEGGKKEKAATAPVAAKEAEGSGEPVPSMIELRVGHIVHSVSFSFLSPILSETAVLMGPCSREAPRRGWALRRADRPRRT